MTSSEEKKDESTVNLIDCHIHFWDLSNFHGKWLQSSKSLTPINKTFLHNDYFTLINNNKNTLLKGINVKSGIYMEADVDNKFVDNEINYALKLCNDKNSLIKGLVFKLNPLDNTSHFKDMLAKYKDNKFVKGIRKVLHTEKDDYCLDKTYLSNLSFLNKEYNNRFTFDIVCKPNIQLQNIQKMISQNPKITFIMDHCGGYHSLNTSNESALNNWKNNMSKLSKYKNVYCKISGLIGSQIGVVSNEWKFDNHKMLLKYVISVFGKDKIIFGGDFPVCNLSGGNNALVKWINEMVNFVKSEYDNEMVKKLFHENAMKVYKM